jgi:hypothetical protein
MVLFDRAIIELSSLVASVTLLQRHQYSSAGEWRGPYINEFGFFFFLRMAVEVSSS